MERGGGSIHFNIFDVNTLRAAQKNPELYEGLQIRVCGWNVRFNDICKEEQDMYIKRAANIQD
jgi:formate C-acetyltransferase